MRRAAMKGKAWASLAGKWGGKIIKIAHGASRWNVIVTQVAPCRSNRIRHSRPVATDVRTHMYRYAIQTRACRIGTTEAVLVAYNFPVTANKLACKPDALRVARTAGACSEIRSSSPRNAPGQRDTSAHIVDLHWRDVPLGQIYRSH